MISFLDNMDVRITNYDGEKGYLESDSNKKGFVVDLGDKPYFVCKDDADAKIIRDSDMTYRIRIRKAYRILRVDETIDIAFAEPVEEKAVLEGLSFRYKQMLEETREEIEEKHYL